MAGIGFRIGAFFVALMAGPMANAQEYQLTNDVQHVAGVIEAHRANLESWQTGDVLIRIRTTGTGKLVSDDGSEFVIGPDEKSVSTENVHLVRLIFDIPQERYLIVNHREDGVRVFDSLDEPAAPPRLVADHRACLVDKSRGIGLGKLKPGQIYRMNRIPDSDSLFNTFSVPQFNGIGVSSYSTRPWTKGSLDQFFDLRWSSDKIDSIEHIGEDRYRVISIHYPARGGRGVRFESDWDVRHQVPVRYASYLGPDRTDKQRRVEAAVWKEIRGQQLPVSARGGFPEWLYLDGQQFVVEYEFETQLRWFSINEDLAEDLFDESVLGDPAKLAELVNERLFDEQAESEGK